jgi:hypothetical protein
MGGLQAIGWRYIRPVWSNSTGTKEYISAINEGDRQKNVECLTRAFQSFGFEPNVSYVNHSMVAEKDTEIRTADILYSLTIRSSVRNNDDYWKTSIFLYQFKKMGYASLDIVGKSEKELEKQAAQHQIKFSRGQIRSLKHHIANAEIRQHSLQLFSRKMT